MVDFYALPKKGNGAWPGRAFATGGSAVTKAIVVESALLSDVSAEMGIHFNSRRFVPFIVMHEFEGLLFSDCGAFSRGLSRPDLELALQIVRDQFETPEDINDSPVTAPSKRTETIMPRYQKPLFGVLAAVEIGLARIRKECAHFDDWLKRLESLVHPI